MQSSDYGKTSFLTLSKWIKWKIERLSGLSKNKEMKENLGFSLTFKVCMGVTVQVARFNITNKTADLLHIMSQCALATTDILLFDHQVCVLFEDCYYPLLKIIKDEYESAPKFHGSLFRVKEPNLIVVSSNRNPRIRSLSHDQRKYV